MDANVSEGHNELVSIEKGKSNPFPLQGLLSTVFDSISKTLVFSQGGYLL